MTKGPWCTKLSRAWPQYPAFILVDLLASYAAVCLTFWGFFVGCNRTPISYGVSWVCSSPPTGGQWQGLDRASQEELKLGVRPGHVFQQRPEVHNGHHSRNAECVRGARVLGPLLRESLVPELSRGQAQCNSVSFLPQHPPPAIAALSIVCLFVLQQYLLHPSVEYGFCLQQEQEIVLSVNLAFLGK